MSRVCVNHLIHGHLNTGKQSSLSPTEAYSRLKELLSDISEQSFLFSPLRPILRLDLEEYVRNCATYEHLLANSIVNQVSDRCPFFIAQSARTNNTSL